MGLLRVDDVCADEDVHDVREDEPNQGELVFIKKGTYASGE